MANVALHLDWAGRGLAGAVVCNANDLAQAAAGAGIHGGTPVGQEPFGACTAALAEDFGHCGHQQAAPHLGVFPLPAWPTPGIGNLAHKGCGFPEQTCTNLVQVRSRLTRGWGGSGPSAVPRADRGHFFQTPVDGRVRGPNCLRDEPCVLEQARDRAQLPARVLLGCRGQVAREWKCHKWRLTGPSDWGRDAVDWRRPSISAIRSSDSPPSYSAQGRHPPPVGHTPSVITRPRPGSSGEGRERCRFRRKTGVSLNDRG
jgi:hypothetical protein